MGDELPHIDQHAITIAARRDAVWAALERYVGETIGTSRLPLLGHLLGTDPPSGFVVAEREPGRRLVLAGRHRFSRYRLVFELEDAVDAATVLRANSYAVFPGPHGRVYRALVIGTRLHVLATRGILHAVRRATASA
ncbi:MAG: hypothetical protein IAG13_07480 [Deltaproteobacteria bacterium]|nr:hypothetical protein [Nannocystaceae bacterium]